MDIRVVAATNSDLHRRMEEGLFRRDLYYRVAGFALRLPALRERREDIPALVQAFLERFAAEAAKGVRGLTIKALRALVEFPWPGNIRELEHEMRRLVYLCPEGQAIDSTMLSPHVAACAPAAEAEEPEPQGSGRIELARSRGRRGSCSNAGSSSRPWTGQRGTVRWRPSCWASRATAWPSRWNAWACNAESGAAARRRHAPVDRREGAV